MKDGANEAARLAAQVRRLSFRNKARRTERHMLEAHRLTQSPTAPAALRSEHPAQVCVLARIHRYPKECGDWSSMLP